MSDLHKIAAAQDALRAAREQAERAVGDLSITDEAVLRLRQAQRLALGAVREEERKAEKGPFSFLKFW